MRAVQEGLAVLAEYLVGGMTVGAASADRRRVSWPAPAMLGWGRASPRLADRMLVRKSWALPKEHGGVQPDALRVYRGGGLAQGRGLSARAAGGAQHTCRAGGSLDPFWMGKIAAAHFSVMQELEHARPAEGAAADAGISVRTIRQPKSAWQGGPRRPVPRPDDGQLGERPCASAFFVNAIEDETADLLHHCAWRWRRSCRGSRHLLRDAGRLRAAAR
jgi:hypothetical protein